MKGKKKWGNVKEKAEQERGKGREGKGEEKVNGSRGG